MKLKATDVFTPGSFPTHTYVDRSKIALDSDLRNALATPGMLVSISGPSKSGKTVLVESVVGKDMLITIPGGSLRSADDVWNRVLDWFDAPAVRTSGTSSSLELGGSVTAQGKIGIPLVAQGSLQGVASIKGAEATSGASTRNRRGMPDVIKEIADSEFVILLDDFHYLPREIQTEVAKQLKEAVRLKVKICTASVAHRADDVVRSLPDLRGRVVAVNQSYWDISELSSIANMGFSALNIIVRSDIITAFAVEAAGSPQLMQQICLQFCFNRNLFEALSVQTELTISESDRKQILKKCSDTTDCSTLVKVLDTGPKTRGVERKTFAFNDNTDGDVYRCLLKAFAADPPCLTFGYSALQDRTAGVCSSGGPIGSSITGSCLKMRELAEESFPESRSIDWDAEKEILEIVDPYLLFFLRWSNKLTTPQT